MDEEEEEEQNDSYQDVVIRKLSRLSPTTVELERAAKCYDDHIDGSGPNSINSSIPQSPTFLKTPRKSMADESESFFQRVFSSKSRGISRATSMASVAFESQFNALTKPTFQSKTELFQYVRELASNYKKTNQLTDVLRSGWFAVTPNLKFEGHTLLHAASATGETKVVTVIAHLAQSENGSTINLEDVTDEGDTALHLAAAGNHPGCIDQMLKHGSQALDFKNKFGLSPIQIACSFVNHEAIDVLLKNDADHTVINEHKETLINLTCRVIFSKFLNIKDEVQTLLEGEILEEQMEDFNGKTYMVKVEEKVKKEETDLLAKSFPTLLLLLDKFKKNPDLLEKEDNLPTSPGTTLHYFACLNFLEGAKIILQEPFLVFHSALNKNQITPLWLASYYNSIQLGIELLQSGADPNVKDPVVGYTPLHCAIYGYHVDRVEETCNFIDALLEHGANPHFVNEAGETAPHLVVGTNDFKVSLCRAFPEK